MKDAPTPRTDAAANESIVKVYKTSKHLERELAEAKEQLDQMAVAFGEFIAAVRINSLRETFKEATPEQIMVWLKPWVEKLAVIKKDQP